MSEQPQNGEIVPAQSNAVALPSDLLAKLGAYAKQTQDAEVVSGQFFGTRAGQLTFNKQPLPGNFMDVIILRSMFERTYYPNAFNPDQFESPLCFGFSQDGFEGMVPHANATEQQAPNCADCQYSKWTLDPRDNKRRVPCKEIRRLSCIPVTATENAAKVGKATAGYLRVPVTSTKFWAEYAQTLAKNGLPPFAVVTRVQLFPDVKNQVRYEFTMLRVVNDADVMTELIKRHEQEEKAMSFPYEKRSPQGPAGEAPPPQAAGGKF